MCSCMVVYLMQWEGGLDVFLQGGLLDAMGRMP